MAQAHGCLMDKTRGPGAKPFVFTPTDSLRSNVPLQPRRFKLPTKRRRLQAVVGRPSWHRPLFQEVHPLPKYSLAFLRCVWSFRSLERSRGTPKPIVKPFAIRHGIRVPAKLANPIDNDTVSSILVT